MNEIIGSLTFLTSLIFMVYGFKKGYIDGKKIFSSNPNMIIDTTLIGINQFSRENYIICVYSLCYGLLYWFIGYLIMFICYSIIWCLVFGHCIYF
jgi:hypothetical protein